MSEEQSGPAVQAPARNKRLRLVAAAAAVIALTAFVHWFAGRNWEATDDAQVEGNLVPISPRVSGYVDQVLVSDNEQVAPGQVLVQLDQRDLEARLRSAEATSALQSAQAEAARTQVTVTERTAHSGEAQAGASVAAAGAGVAGAQAQIAAAWAQAEAARAAAEAARDAVTSARADVDNAGAQIAAAQAAAEAANADVTAAQAQAKRTALDAARYKQLTAAGAVAQQQYDAAEAADVSAQAALNAARRRTDAAQAGLAQARSRKQSAESALQQALSHSASVSKAADQAAAAARAVEAGLAEAQARLSGSRAAESAARTAPQQIDIGRSQQKAAAARAQAATADLQNARLQLGYTRIAAPVAGVVSRKSAEPGQYVQPGQLLMAVVPLSNAWVVANFKETQVGRMRKGQRAVIEVDAYGGRSLSGRVDSIGAATGATFSLLPPENATGNFVKVVQRIPVKIVVERPLPDGVVLRPGMNVVARVDISSGK